MTAGRRWAPAFLVEGAAFDLASASILGTPTILTPFGSLAEPVANSSPDLPIS